jgi:hypothetical protein
VDIFEVVLAGAADDELVLTPARSDCCHQSSG